LVSVGTDNVSSAPNPADLINEDVFESVSFYLDRESLRAARLVCWRWYNLVQPIANRRWIYILPDLRQDSTEVPSRVRLETGAFLNRWKTTYSFINTIHPFILREYGANVKHLVIKNLPLDEQSSVWFSNAVPFAFANLEEIKVRFGGSEGNRIEHKQEEAPGSRFRNLHTLTIKNGSGPYRDYVTNIIGACTGKLQHLFLIGSTLLDGNLLDWLADHADVTEGLVSFEFRSSPYSYGDHLRPIKFSDKLRTFRWDRLHFGTDMNSTKAQILRGTLDQIAGSITHFSTSEGLWNPQSRTGRFSTMFFPVQFSIMPELSVMKLDTKTCYTVSLSDLVDAAPNLRRLEITGNLEIPVHVPPTEGRAGFTIPENDIWCCVENPKMKEHRALRVLRVQPLLRDLSILKNTLQKFPYLEELSTQSHWWVPVTFDQQTRKTYPCNLETVFDILLKFGRNIKIFEWDADVSHSLFEICRHLVQVQKHKSLLLYKLTVKDTHADEDFEFCLDVLPDLVGESHFDLKDYILRKEEILKELLTLQDMRCRIELGGDRFYAIEGCQCNGDESIRCKDCLDEFRMFFTNSKLPVTFFRLPDIPFDLNSDVIIMRI
jgi:hypothetical protein